jgi:hypothetical protein
MGPKEIHPFIDNRSKKGKQKNMNSQSSDHVSDLKKKIKKNKINVFEGFFR